MAEVNKWLGSLEASADVVRCWWCLLGLGSLQAIVVLKRHQQARGSDVQTSAKLLIRVIGMKGALNIVQIDGI